VVLWQRLLITLATMLLASFVAGLLWQELFSRKIPGYLSGIIGGIGLHRLRCAGRKSRSVQRVSDSARRRRQESSQGIREDVQVARAEALDNAATRLSASPRPAHWTGRGLGH
jgi:hypothetical protein